MYLQNNWASSWDFGTYHIGYQRRLRRACASAHSRQSLRCSHTWSMEVDEGSHQNQTSSPTGWLRMRIWRMSSRRTNSTMISWAGSIKLSWKGNPQEIQRTYKIIKQQAWFEKCLEICILGKHFDWALPVDVSRSTSNSLSCKIFNKLCYVFRKRTCAFGLNSHHCALADLDKMMSSSEWLKSGLSPGKRSQQTLDDPNLIEKYER